MINLNEKSYVKFPEGKQTEFLRTVKANTVLTWKKIAKVLKVDRSMIFFYLDEHSKLPYDSFIKLCTAADLSVQKFEYEKINLNFRGIAKVPNKITPQLAEFVGALLGDGSISPSKYQICVSMDGVLDEDYVKTFVRTHFILLFKKTPCVYYSKTARNIKCYIYSKKIFDYLTIKLGLPFGERKYKPNNIIPKIFFERDELLTKVLRGLFDTEGGFYQHNRTSPRLYIYNTSEPLLDSIQIALLKLGYNSIKKKKWIKICRKNEIQRFFNEIGTSNSQKLLKYQMWLEDGKVPSTKKILAYHSR